MGTPAALLFALAQRPAQAESSVTGRATLPITLELGDGCKALDQVELYKLLAIEFHTLRVLPATPRERVQVECAEARAVVTLQSVNASNELELSATSPALWPRLLALSVSEIVIESRARATPKPEPRPTPKAMALPPIAQATPVREDGAFFRGFAGLALRRAVRPATWLSGPELGATLELSRIFSLASALRLEFGNTDTALAKIDWLSASGAIALLAGGSIGRWGLSVGPGVRIGYLRLSAQPEVAGAAGHTVSGPWAGPELVAHARYDLGARWFVLGGVDSGIVTTSVTGLLNGEQQLLDTGGAWLSALLGAGISL